MRIDVKNGEYLIVRTRPAATVLRSAVIWGLFLALLLGFGVGAFNVLQDSVTFGPEFNTALTYAYWIVWALVVLLFVYPGVIRPFVRYLRHRTWLTNQRLVHRRFFPAITNHAGRRPPGYRTVTVDLGSITELRFGRNRRTSADIWVHYGYGETVRLPQIPNPQLFVDTMWAEVSKNARRTNVDTAINTPGERWDKS